MSMPRYIDATLAKAQFTGNFQDSYSPGEAKAMIDEVPTVDVAPVVHAHWKHVGTAAGVGMVYHCSRCERQVIVDYAFMLSQYPYCHCGAKMDEVTK